MRNVKMIMMSPNRGVIIAKNFIFIKCNSSNNNINNNEYMLPTIYIWIPEIRWLKNRMVRAISFGKIQKIWTVIQGGSIFPSFLGRSEDLDIIYGG